MALALSTGRNLETPGIVTGRYVKHGMPASLPLTVTSPADRASIDTATVPVSGTATAGALVVAEAVGGTGGTAATASTTADSAGNWSLTLPAGFGSTTITVTATLGRSTGYSQLSVTNVALPGTSVLDVADPAGDDNGPGTYAYPTDPVFVAGEFDLTRFRVSQTGTDVYIQMQVRKMVNTFGSDFGAQLLDLYVRDPAASAFSTSAAFASRNYSIARGSAWSQRLEAQGFASPVWQDASGNSLGNPQLVVDDPSGTATLILPKAAFGTVGSGWVFTIALTGQDGSGGGIDQARRFTPTPGDFTFGVCGQGVSSPICSFGPGTVPKVMDTITPPPPGVSQADELDPSSPVLLAGVPVPASGS